MMANSNMSNTPGPGEGGAEGDMPPSADALRADADAVVSEAQDLAGKVAAEANDQVSQLKDQAQAKVAETAQKVKGMAAEQKDFLAAQIGGVADAMEKVADELESNNGSSASYARMIADNAEKLSDTIRNNDVDQIFHMAQDFGRRQPALFIGAAALLGFAASRFLAASAQRPAMSESEMEEPDYMPTGTTSERSGAGYETGRY